MTFKSTLLLFSLLGFLKVSFATETQIQNSTKIDSIINVHVNSGVSNDSTIVNNMPYEKTSIVGFSASLVSILSWAFQIFRISTVLSLLFNPVLFGLIGLVFSIIAVVRIKKNGKKGKKLALAGIILTILHALLLGSFVILLFRAMGGN